MGRKILLLTAVFLLAITVVYAQETLTISTYYPSPYGSYHDLEVSNSLILRTDATSPAADAPQIEWRTSSARHWNIDQDADNLRFFTEAADGTGGLVRMSVSEGGNLVVNGSVRSSTSGNLKTTTFAHLATHNGSCAPPTSPGFTTGQAFFYCVSGCDGHCRSDFSFSAGTLVEGTASPDVAVCGCIP